MNIQSLAPAPPLEQRLLLEGVSWQRYETLLATLGDDFPNLRLSYREGSLEIMSTSPEHEELKKMIGMLLEAYFQEARIRFHAMGSATFRKALKQRGLEPDECYCIGSKKEFPDLALEVVLSGGLIDKLDIYAGLGIPEVWQWQAGEFSIYGLRSSGYLVMSESELLPNLDLKVLAQYVNPAEQYESVMAFREQIRPKA
ncbi:MAG: Uma2 family endonuclease [Thermostichus sp. HHBFW_bins_43]